MDTITSADGTPIAHERSGSGPPLVLVHGTTADHSRWDPVRPALAEHFTLYAIDRRGRGESGDAAEYDPEREFEDVAAVVDSIAEPAALLGHSYGALCSLGAALRTENLRKLVLYEPPSPIAHEPDSRRQPAAKGVFDDLEATLDDGHRERAVDLFLRDVVRIPPAGMDALRSAPDWPTRVDAAHTLSREVQAVADYEFDATRFAEMTAPTLLVAGDESPRERTAATAAVAAALPNSRRVTLEGHHHVAMNTAPRRFVDEVLGFLRDSA